MGLDMYMSKKTYVKQWSHNKPEDQFNVDIKKGGEPFSPIKKERVSYVVEEVAYWRKFNALHNWFVNKCADGVDECQPIYVSEERMKELLETLHKVKEVYDSNPPDKEEQLDDIFPTSSGFFFGGTEYDEYYIQEVNETIELIENLLEEEGGDDYEYQASW
jgi:hypothetical protein